MAPAFDPRGALAAIALGGAAVVIAACFRWAGYDYGWEEYPGLPLLSLGVVALALVQRLRPRTGVPSWLFAGAGLYALVHWTVLWVAESLHFAAYVAGGALLVLATAALRLVRGTRRAAAPTAAAPAPLPAETPVIPADDERDERPPSSHETPTTGAWAIRAAAREATDGVEPS